MILNILEKLGLHYNPKKHTLKVPNGQKKEDKKTPSKQTQRTDIVYSGGKAFIQKDTADGFEADIYNGSKDERQGHLTDTDKDEVKRKGLDMDKAAEIKKTWAAGMSAKETETHINKKGFKLRTIQKYFAVFNYNQAKQ